MAKKTEYTKTNNYKDLPSEYGKVPPQAVDLEEAVLGALMLEKDAFAVVGDLLKPECFYKDAHQRIFRAVHQLFIKDEPVDLLTVSEKLKSTGELEQVGGYYYLSQLTSRVASAAHIEFHARIIVQKFIQRKLIGVCTELQDMAYDEATDVADLVDKAQKSVFDIADGNIQKDTAEIAPIIEDAIRGIEAASKRPDGISGIPSGFTALDEVTSGWQNSDLVIIAARPAMGKTAFVLSMARNMAVTYKQPIAVFSLEMSSVQLVNRLIASETELGSEKIKNGRLSEDEWKHLHSKIKTLITAPILVDDTPALSIFELRAKCRRLKQKYDIKVIIIDYLQLMTAGADMRGNREQEVSMISRQLKIIAKELNIPVLALSQLNRGVELRTGDAKKPMLSDLRESGAIEQDADMVLFIHRPEKYGIMTDAQGNSLKGIADIIIAKHRNGAVGEIQLRFRSELTQFCDLETTSPFHSETSTGELVTQTFTSKMNDEPVPPLDTSFEEGAKAFSNPGFPGEAPF
ncbi:MULTISPECIES: replicative DNA helicase [Culturomica]|jgi:replicative DNA helicase|uniref:replicative DNA helicase n=1 Tax=Culturomica TaxID=1926651 RepID=UPI000335EF6B|nr:MULTISPECIES: replicative DNA helicase [Odoribacteraceae]RHV95619.1 replicative DNA helicase [Odoribacter sp. OF09-27XD]CCZ06226.1 replicative DNA helicase [Odoribacter sp. CAG:788]HBO27115.1 replicative DNA helicase [Culturomica sp.]